MGLFDRNFGRDFRLLTSPLRAAPDFIIPGETKCGTTSLYHYLTQNPDIFGSDEKEPKNFIRYPASMAYCRMHFPFRSSRFFHNLLSSGKFRAGEASAEYLSAPEAPANIAKLLPDLRLIILMRNPVIRAYSDYQMFYEHGSVKESFGEVVRSNITWLNSRALAPVLLAASKTESNPARYIAKGIYVENIKNWLTCFPRESFLFIKSETFFDDPQTALDSVSDFLGVRRHRPKYFPVKKKGAYKNLPEPAEIKMMAEFYRPHNQKLYDLLGVDYRWEREVEQLFDATEG